MKEEAVPKKKSFYEEGGEKKMERLRRFQCPSGCEKQERCRERKWKELVLQKRAEREKSESGGINVVLSLSLSSSLLFATRRRRRRRRRRQRKKEVIDDATMDGGKRERSLSLMA